MRSRQKYLDLWSPRLGRQAAQLRLQGVNAQSYAFGLYVVMIACGLAGVRAHIRLLDGVAIGAWVAECVVTIWMVRCYRASHKAASAALGLRIGMFKRNGPPRDTEAYKRWCEKHGLPPFAADLPH